jgi:hypothetical protein
MARKTFISYKYSEASGLRDTILKKLGNDSQFYQGETADSPDLTDTTAENIKNNLKDMIFASSVTIVIISPEMKNSRWIDWEIEYSLKEITREDRTSRTNGVVGVIMKYNGGYGWLVSYTTNPDGCQSRAIDTNYLYPIINKNRFNLNTENKFSCPTCKTYSILNGSYFALIDQDTFLSDPEQYIENAYEKSNQIENYSISKER